MPESGEVVTDLVVAEATEVVVKKQWDADPGRYMLRVLGRMTDGYERDISSYRGYRLKGSSFCFLKKVTSCLRQQYGVPEDVLKVVEEDATYAWSPLYQLILAVVAMDYLDEIPVKDWGNRKKLADHLRDKYDLGYKGVHANSFKAERQEVAARFIDEQWALIKKMRNDELNSCAIGAVSSVVDSGHEDGKTRISGAETLLKLTEEGGFGKNKMDVNLNLSATPMSKPGWMMTKDG